MVKIDVTYPGDTITKSFTALVRQPVSPTTAQPIDIGLVEISTPYVPIPGPIGPPGPGVVISDTPPPNPKNGTQWWESDTGILWAWYVEPAPDGDSAQWVQISGGVGGPEQDLPITPQMFGAAGDGVTDDTAALQAAADSGYDIYVPAGLYKVTDMVTIPTGSTWQGAGRTRSVIHIPATFNLSALGVLRLGTGEPGASLFDIGIEFQQNTAETVRANVVHYPPAIYAVAVPRVQIDRVRISSAWDGILMTGNCGGAYLGRLEICGINCGLKIDGSEDFVHGESWHFWPFGLGNTNIYTLIYKDGTTTACELGRADLFQIDKIAAFDALVKLNSAVGQVGSHIVNALTLDGKGSRLACTSVDNWLIGSLSTQKATGTFGPDISISSAGRIRIGSLYTGGSRNSPAVSVTGGSIGVNSGFLSQTDVTQQWGLVAAGGRLEVRNCTLAAPAAARGAIPYIEQTGGALWVKNCNAEASTGSGPLVKIGSDNAFNDISDNGFSVFSLDLVTGANLGRYGPNRLTRKTFVPVLTFATPGDLAYTATAAAGGYYWDVNGYWFNLRLVITGAITYTTAAGALRIGGLPAQHKGLDAKSLDVRWGRLDLNAGYTAVGASISVNTDYITLIQSGDNLGALGITSAQVPSGMTGFEIAIDGFIPTI